MKIKQLFPLAIALVAGGTVFGQQSFVATGGEASGSGGSVSYSVGQLALHHAADSSNSLLAGVQQPYEILIQTNVEDDFLANLSFSSYPNPTVDVLTLSVENLSQHNLRYQLVNVSGQILRQGMIRQSNTPIQMSEFTSATYFLQITSESKPLKTFTIIKN